MPAMSSGRPSASLGSGEPRSPGTGGQTPPEFKCASQVSDNRSTKPPLTVAVVDRRQRTGTTMRITPAALWTIIGFLTATALVALGVTVTRAVHAAQWDPTGEIAQGLYEKPLLPFAVVMGAAITVVTATVVALWRAKLLIPAIGTAAGAGIGPLSLLAFPIWETPDTTPIGSGAPALLFGALFTGVIVAIAAVASTRLDPQMPDWPAPSWKATAGYLLIVAIGALTLTAVPAWTENAGQGPLDMTMVYGWVLLTAGILTAGAAGQESRATTAIRSVTWMGVPVAMAAVMHRPSGWPGAPGWEWSANNLPQYLSLPLAVIIIGSALIGWGLAYAPWHPTAQRATPSPQPGTPVPA